MASAHRLGKLPPRYSFALNPHQDARFARCPLCEQKTRLRKFVYVEDSAPMALGKTCRFCTRCGLIIAHQDELEHELVVALETRDPGVVGNEYAVLGTVDRKPWRKVLKEGSPVAGDALDHVADFDKEYDLHYEPGGWERA